MKYNQQMDIPQPICKQEIEEGSLQDACFQLTSQLLVPVEGKKESSIKTKISYRKSFQPILCSQLLKKTLNTSWKQRYFVLTPTRLIYYSDSSLHELKGCFLFASLAEYSFKIKFNEPEISFLVKMNEQLEGSKTLLQLMIEDKNLFNQWKKQLTRIISKLQSLSKEDFELFPKIRNQELLQTNIKVGTSGNFWNKIVISTHQLLKYASHLDIILLRSKNPLFYLHRFFMRSYYDHVAVVIKDETERLFLFEAIQSRGVCVSSLESLLLTFKDQYEQLGYRKLLVEPQTVMHIDKLQDYINSLLGSKYELSLSKIFLDNSSIKESLSEHQNSIETSKTGKTYFCSELIADLYLKFGIISSGKSNNFWPKDFESSEMDLTKGYKLSPIMTVQVNDLLEASQLSN